MNKQNRGVFITGTDTGVGKTEIACGFMCAYAALGHTVIGMKPVAAGARKVRGELHNPDVALLQRAANVMVGNRAMNPYVFAAAIAPHLAAERVGTHIDVDVIMRAFSRLAQRADIVVVEGIGGFLVPLNARSDTGDLTQRLGLPVLLVVGMRLGCLSHALLTAAAISRRRLKLAGWIANRVDPAMRAYRGNIETLKARLDAPLLAEVAFHPDPARRRAAIDRALRTGTCVKAFAAPR